MKEVVIKLTKNDRHDREKSNMIVNMIIVMIIAVGIILLDFVTISKLKDYDSAIKEAMFIQEDLPIIDDSSAEAEIIQYQSNTYNMIEVYDSELNLIMSVKFGDIDDKFPVGNIKEYPDLMDRLKENDKGRFLVDSIESTGDQEEISFRWLVNNQGETRLIVIYSIMPVVKDVWMISTICYGILIMVLVLMFKFILQRYTDRISMYKYISML